MVDGFETGRKTEMATSCRLFGFDLMNPSTVPTTTEKAPVSSLTMEVHVLSPLSAADSEQKSGLSKSYKEKKEQILVSPKETQSRQSCTTSTRTRTKV